jgi:uncharacterized protein
MAAQSLRPSGPRKSVFEPSVFPRISNAGLKPSQVLLQKTAMFSLQQFFGKGDKFFGLLEASAEEVHSSVDSLLKMLQQPGKTESMDSMILSRRKDKKITEQISEALVKSFVTGLEREDIEALSNALYKIPKTVEKFAERFHLASNLVEVSNFSKQIDLVTKATDTIVGMVKQLRKTPPLEQVKELNDRLQLIEGDADKLMVELLRELYSGKHEPLKALALKDLYELLEKIIDRCRDAGNIVYHIILKNS